MFIQMFGNNNNENKLPKKAVSLSFEEGLIMGLSAKCKLVGGLEAFENIKHRLGDTLLSQRGNTAIKIF